VGKTTVIRAVASALPRRQVHGFYSEEIRRNGERVGFRAVTFDGRKVTMARVGLPGPRVGKYGVDVAAIGELAASALALRRGGGMYLIDEIGKMECLAPRFVAAVRVILDSTVPVVATVGLRGGGFIAEVKRRRDAELWEVTRANRDAAPDRVLEWMTARG
jgi:nucleoside-triphosphatase